MTDREHEEWLKDEQARKERAESSHTHPLHHPLPPQDDYEERKRRAEEEELLKKKKLAD